VIRSYVITCRIGVEIAALKKKTSTRGSQRQPSAGKTGDTGDQNRVALTLKVDHGTYVRLCTLGATERRTNQEILDQALREYLDRQRA
jgi:hypothetical protein